MKKLKGSLTPAQHEIMRVVWKADGAGATVAEIWKTIAAGRDVSRTTILNLVDRLQKRGWLKRVEGEGVHRFQPAMGHEKTAVRLAGEFVDSFFGGSAANMVSSLLGSEKLGLDDVKRLREILAEAERTKNGGPA